MADMSWVVEKYKEKWAEEINGEIEELRSFRTIAANTNIPYSTESQIFYDMLIFDSTKLISKFNDLLIYLSSPLPHNSKAHRDLIKKATHVEVNTQTSPHFEMLHKYFKIQQLLRGLKDVHDYAQCEDVLGPCHDDGYPCDRFYYPRIRRLEIWSNKLFQAVLFQAPLSIGRELRSCIKEKMPREKCPSKHKMKKYIFKSWKFYMRSHQPFYNMASSY